MELNLLDMPKHSSNSRGCSVNQLRPNAKRVSLLKHKKLRGWWPASVVVADGNEEKKELTVNSLLIVQCIFCTCRIILTMKNIIQLTIGYNMCVCSTYLHLSLFTS